MALLIYLSSSNLLKSINPIYAVIFLLLSVTLLCTFSCILDLLRRICLDSPKKVFRVLPYNETDTSYTITYIN